MFNSKSNDLNLIRILIEFSEPQFQFIYDSVSGIFSFHLPYFKQILVWDIVRLFFFYFLNILGRAQLTIGKSTV